MLNIVPDTRISVTRFLHSKSSPIVTFLQLDDTLHNSTFSTLKKSNLWPMYVEKYNLVAFVQCLNCVPTLDS